MYSAEADDGLWVNSVHINIMHAFAEHARDVEAYVHPNGFARLVLAKFLDGSRLMLHCWLDEEDWTDVHDHRYDFGSRIIMGGLHHRELNLDVFGDRYDLCRYDTSDGGASSTLNLVCRVDVSVAKEFTQRVRHNLSVNGALLHQVCPIQFPTMSLVVQGPPKRDYANVIVPKFEATKPYEAPQLNADHLGIIQRLIRRVP